MRCLLLVCLALPGCFAAQGPTHEPSVQTAKALAKVEPDPIKPRNVHATVEGQTVTLSWDAMAGVRKYHMQWAAASAPHVLLGKASITTPVLKVPDLDGGRYIFQVGQETARGPGPMESIEATVAP